MTKIEKIVSGFIIIAFIAFFITVYYLFNSINELKSDPQTIWLSPCQCKIRGGCTVQGFVKNDKFYSDGTQGKDYDEWGRYTGDMDVPEECK